ncbi:ATP synthase F1 subunit epsilon [Parvularcula sp. ZS-1/3]|uniref:ATP synthase epsilon chain n=1 Tax=Parvularcula mediterranea TaxID=2732508 RepID=A0A7Y3W568_9PROT|nr:ATP synthase F1 subunit epsilon [Parvularcula mediterranea]NNU15936.1 ATP synthase F1 subunit epsilon [Parvularcula mediterranea]
MAQFAFSLVSPERELFSGDVDAVVVPGTEGTFEVRAGHAPLMATLSPGLLEVHQGGEVTRTYVRGGFADVGTSGLTVLAEKAINESDLQGDTLTSERDEAQATVDAEGEEPEKVLNARRALDSLAKY